MAITRIRPARRNNGIAHTILDANRQLPTCEPSIRGIRRRQLEVPLGDGPATTDILLETISIVAKLGRVEVLAADLELVIEKFV